MNLETKITIYKFTPQVFTLTRFFMPFYKGTLFVVKTYFRQHIYFLHGFCKHPHK